MLTHSRCNQHFRLEVEGWAAKHLLCLQDESSPFCLSVGYLWPSALSFSPLQSSLSSPDLLDSPSPEEERREREKGKEEQDSFTPKSLDNSRKMPKAVPVITVSPLPSQHPTLHLWCVFLIVLHAHPSSYHKGVSYHKDTLTHMWRLRPSGDSHTDG